VGLRPLEIVIDCADHDVLERFWTAALGWDFAADDMAAEVERLRGLGATWIAERQLFGPPSWTVMADPEGNEFCVAGRPDS